MKSEGTMNHLENIRKQVLALPTVDREQLMEDILASFDPNGRESIDKAWVAEALDRIAAYDRGEMEAFTVEEVRMSIGPS